MPHWYDNPSFVRRVKINLNWIDRAWDGIVLDGHPLPISGKAGSNEREPVDERTKAAIKRCKELLGLPKAEQVWGSDVDDTFLERLHHPTGYGITPAQAKLGLRLRNEARGVRNAPRTDRERALFIAHNAHFWTGGSTGSERIKFEQLAARGVAWCNHRRMWTRVESNLLAFIVDCVKATPTMVNELNGGDHPYEDWQLAHEAHPDLRHYANPCKAVDIDLSLGSTQRRMGLAHKHGGSRNREQSHEHYDIPA